MRPVFATCNYRMAALGKYRLDEHGNINDGRIPKLTFKHELEIKGVIGDE